MAMYRSMSSAYTVSLQSVGHRGGEHTAGRWGAWGWEVGWMGKGGGVHVGGRQGALGREVGHVAVGGGPCGGGRGKFTLVISSMHTRKSSGPSIEPHGTPEITGITPDDPYILHWLCSYLTNREQKVIIEGASSWSSECSLAKRARWGTE